MSGEIFNLGRMFAEHLVDRAKQPGRSNRNTDPTTRSVSRVGGDEYVSSLNPNGPSAAISRLRNLHQAPEESTVSQRGRWLTSNSGNPVSNIHSDQFVQQLRGGLAKAANPDSRYFR